MAEASVMWYDIYDTDTGNLWASFPSEEEALAEVRRAAQTDGEDAIAAWALGRSDHAGEALYGSALIERAVSAFAS